MSNLQTHPDYKLDFQKVDQHTGGKWLIHSTKYRKDHQLIKAWNSPVEYISRESKHNIKESEGNMFNPIFKGNVQGRKHRSRRAFAEPELKSQKSECVVQKKGMVLKILIIVTTIVMKQSSLYQENSKRNT